MSSSSVPKSKRKMNKRQRAHYSRQQLNQRANDILTNEQTCNQPVTQSIVVSHTPEESLVKFSQNTTLSSSVDIANTAIPNVTTPKEAPATSIQSSQTQIDHMKQQLFSLQLTFNNTQSEKTKMWESYAPLYKRIFGRELLEWSFDENTLSEIYHNRIELAKKNLSRYQQDKYNQWEREHQNRLNNLNNQLNTVTRELSTHERSKEYAALRGVAIPSSDMIHVKNLVENFNRLNKEITACRCESFYFDEKKSPLGQLESEYEIQLQRIKNITSQSNLIYEKISLLEQLLNQEEWLERYLAYACEHQISYRIDNVNKDDLFYQCNVHHNHDLVDSGVTVCIRGWKHTCKSYCSGWLTTDYECSCGKSNGWSFIFNDKITDMLDLETFNIEATEPLGYPHGGEWDRYDSDSDDDSDNDIGAYTNNTEDNT